ncbi:hypothetical protein T552_02696 [Pneumocystis carinii B80]|uniref:Mso1 N-terminal domain-containing protein n=1 Tax=Pneumocystis carinii (strain B80) TaxID=1408658 RepID=A0A0W4ZEA4_PNEC8|nr:hypothetical protein T552_02696 [Pneumocystis carinii B80]KTW26689.1 hypothetical protein T552_02696 [Pneumocystis carinii B80]
MTWLENFQVSKEENHGSRMWDRIISATGAISKAMADKYVAIVNEDEDHNIENENQSKVSRVLREYYIRKNGCLPEWLKVPEEFERRSIKSSESVPANISNHDNLQNTRVVSISFRDIYDSTPKNNELPIKSASFNTDECRYQIPSASERLREKLSRRNMNHN